MKSRLNLNCVLSFFLCPLGYGITDVPQVEGQVENPVMSHSDLLDGAILNTGGLDQVSQLFRLLVDCNY